jgi:hypothetical protein
MFRKHAKIFYGIIFLLLTAVFLLNIPKTSAASQFWFSWEAGNYAPSWYQGKVLPIVGSPLAVSFELVDNGALADLSQSKIRWYVNDRLIINENSGLGIQSVSFNVPDYANNAIEVRVSIVDYQGTTLDRILYIPLAQPEVVIEMPSADGRISVGDSIFRANPFFFNINNLNQLDFEWVVNGKQPETLGATPWLLSLNVDSKISSGTPIDLSLTVNNTLNDAESAVRNIQPVVK